MLLARYKRKSYLHRIVTGDEKLIYFENPKRNRSYIDPGQPSKSTARPNRFGRKTMLRRQHEVIFLDDNAPNHRAKPTKDIVKALDWEPLAHAAYSPDFAPSDYHLFASLGHASADQRFTSYENVKSWLDDWLASKDRSFFWRGIHKLPKRWGECVSSDGYYFK
ncbi:mariner Mos1 transposase [Trichonephila clavipes]|uniref:Mariner Mos1 transposase n=1 Tax=Trichonephila clavipes TaxID=2585209 RepID=A0A8X7BIV8_TRICX|nr:mariner Mos1 transposase [Trichonephila clavipes]